MATVTQYPTLARGEPVAPAAAGPQPRAGRPPCVHPCPRIRGDSLAVQRPRAYPAMPASAPPKHIVDGTPETLAAAFALGGLALGADVTAAGATTVARSAAGYVTKLAAGIIRCVSDPLKTGEHIAEGVVGGAAWAAAAAGVSALADAARSHAGARVTSAH